MASPVWLRWAYGFLVVSCVAGGLFILLAKVNEYASGPAVIRARGRMDLTARDAAIVSSVEVVPGQKVAAGQVLVQFHAAAENAELSRARHEYELQLIKLLRDPADPTAREAVTSLRAQAELAEAKLAERALKAPRAGTVGDIRIRPGQALAAGETALVFTGDDASFRVVTALPGHYLPMLRAGMPLRMELTGYRYAYQALTIESLETQVIGPTEVRRYLGQELSDSLDLTGPLVLVQGTLPKQTFSADGTQFTYYDGMHGRAQARVRTSRLITLLAPWVKAFVSHGK